jgi:xanthine dehydrogenase accessory factor
MTLTFYQQLAQCLAQGAVTVATVTEIQGSVPREIGAKMLISQQGGIYGTIGGGAGEAKVIEQAQDALKTGESQWVEIDLSGAAQRETQGVCGGKMQVWLAVWRGTSALTLAQEIVTSLRSGRSLTLVTPYTINTRSYLLQHPVPTGQLLEQAFIEPLHPQPILLIVGAGHCGIELAKVAHLLDFQVVVQDERPEWANPIHYPHATQIFADSVEVAIASLSSQAQLYAALVTRGYEYDVRALRALSARPIPCAYIGMMGSRKRVQRVLQTLEGIETGLHSLRETVFAPIGLDIGALTPAEIAVSIAAELILVRRGGMRRSP